MKSEPSKDRGRLKIYLGYAAGVGKTFQMLEEAQELRRTAVDVVIGYFEPHGRRETIAKTDGLEMIPRRQITYRGTTFEEMDTAAILKRNPRICLVDELAHTNVPGSERTKRWEDVRILLDAGIDVHSTLNIQHLESLNDQIFQLTGVRVRETIPDWVVDEADELVLVDLTPRALQHRLERGVIYPPEKAREAIENFFVEQNLSSLRELSLRQAAHEVEGKLAEASSAAVSCAEPAVADARRECVLICMDEKPATAMLIRRGKRVANYLHGDCVAVFVLPNGDWGRIPASSREAMEKHLNFARNLRIETHILNGKDIPETLIEFARSRQATQIFMGRGTSKGVIPLLLGTTVHRVVRQARDMQITIVADPKGKEDR